MTYRYPLRATLPAVLLVFSCVLALLVFAIQSYEVDRSIGAQLGERAAHLGNALSGRIQDHTLDGRPALIQRELERQATEPDLALILIGDADGRVTHSTDQRWPGMTLGEVPGAPPAALLAAILRGHGGQTWRPAEGDILWGIYPVAQPPAPGELRARRSQLLLVKLDGAGLRAHARQQAYRDVGLFVAGIAVFSLLSWLYLRHAYARRIGDLAKSMQRFMDGRSDTLPPIEGGDEIAQLAGHYHRLADDLTRRNEELREEIRTRAEAERALRESEARYRALIDHLPYRIFLKDRDSRYLSCNAAYARDLGIAAEAIVGQDDHAFHPAELAAQYQADDRRVMAAGEPVELEERYRMDGEERWIHTIKVPMFDEGGIAGVLGIFQDITEKRQVEARLRLAASVFENSQDGILITDSQRAIIAVNPAFARITGFTAEEVVGKNPRLLRSGLHDDGFYQRMWRILADTDHWQGEIWNRRKDGTAYVELLNISAVRDSQGGVTHYVGMFTDIQSLKDTQSRLERMAHYDALTELPNRALLTDRMRQALAHADRYEQLLAVCFLDLDGFKPVNDQYGHNVGDRLLVEVAGRLKQAVRAGDTAARLGGDEFVLLLTDFHQMGEVEPVLGRILHELSAPYQVMGKEIRISTSIGVTAYPLDNGDADTLIRHADQAMYQAKQAGRNRYHLFDAEQDRQSQARREELDHIRSALENDELVLHYQPKVNLRGGRVIGAEALLRWQSPSRGLVPPGEFLPLVEASDLIVAIGEWVIAAALDQMARWRAAGLEMPVSVNIASRHLQRADFVGRLRALLGEHPSVPPHWLELEILESSALQDMEHVRGVIEGCRQMGVRFALDDFGTGYSSLSYLKHIPADVLKIDRSFVQDILDDADDLALVESVVGLATTFRREVIAEGMETAEHGLMLLRMGCDVAQGYGLARPMPAADLAGWSAAFRPDPRWAVWADVKWEMADFPLLMAQHDHVQWVQRVTRFVEGGALALSDGELTDHRQCRFGRWYYGQGRLRYNRLPEYAGVEPIHDQVHQIGPQIVRLCNAGEIEAARALIPQLHELRERILDQLARLQRAVAGGLGRAER